MSRRRLEDLDGGYGGNLWDYGGGEDFDSFVGDAQNNIPSHMNGLCVFLNNIVRDFPAEESDQILCEMLNECFCEWDEEREIYTWSNEPSDLFYGIILAAIEDDATRDELQAQIESESLALLMQEINRHKETRRMNHKEAFSDLEIVRYAERGEIPRDFDIAIPTPTVAATARTRISDIGGAAGPDHNQDGDTGATR